MVPRRTLRVGLTGGIASGKSHVLSRLDAAGFATIDLDRVAHGLIAPGGAAYAAVVAAFGASILDRGGAVDRKKLGALVFASADARARLDAIVHPLVREQEAGMARAAEAKGARVLVTDAALLVEAGMHLRFDRLVVTWCAPDAQMARLRGRDGVDEAAARARLAAQMPPDEKRTFAHDVIDTSGMFAETDAQVAALVPRLQELRPASPLAVPPERAAACLREGPAAGPRGLTPPRLLKEVEAAGGFEMARLAGLLDPPARGPWYRSALADAGPPGPETLAGALAVCCAARGADPPYVLGAAASLARLTHTHPQAVAGACLAALAAWEVAARGTLSALEEPAPALWAEQARERAGAAPLNEVVEEVRRAAAGAAVAGTLSGALAGLAGGQGAAKGG